MEQKRLGDYVKIKTGKLDANASSINGKYPFFTCSVNNLWIDTFAYDCECVLIAGNGDLNVKYYEGKFNAYQRTYIVESNDKTILDVRYLYYFMSKYVNVLRNNSIGGVIKYIKLGDLTEVFIPIPPLETQKKIVEVLDKAQGLIDARKEQIRLMDELIQSVFYEMFGNLSKNSMNWDEYTLKEVTSKITDGTHKTPKYLNEGVVFLSAKNIKNSCLVFDDVKYISEEEHEILSKRCNVEFGDLLITKSGSTGTAAIVDTKVNFSVFESLALIKYKRDIIESQFLKTHLNDISVKRQYDNMSKGGTIKHLHLNELRKVKICVPPVSIQRIFVEKIGVVEVQKIKLLESKSILYDTYNSLIQRAFNGDLFGGE